MYRFFSNFIPNQTIKNLTDRNDELKNKIAERELEIKKFEDDYFRDCVLHEMMHKRNRRSRFLQHYLTNETFGPGVFPDTPPKLSDLSEEIISQFTLNGKIPMHEVYVDDTYPSNHPLIYTDDEMQFYEEMLSNGENYVYGGLDDHLREAFKDFPIEGKDILITGSITPWYENFCLSYGAIPTTVDYNEILCESKKIKTITIKEQLMSDKRYDCVLSISSFEHDGLGAYGDPIAPDGDLRAMRDVLGVIKPDGHFFFNVPCGEDHICFNRHRQYGSIRMPMMLNGWDISKTYGVTMNTIDDAPSNPVFVLRPAVAS